MQFTPGSGHDGFDIARTIDDASSGQLAAGQYFAVALHRSGGNWICPADVDEDHSHGAVTNLCFYGAGGGCAVTFVVTPMR